MSQHSHAQEPLPVASTSYYRKAISQVPDANTQVESRILKSDLFFWEYMLQNRIQCATEWSERDDFIEHSESDLAVFSELLQQLQNQHTRVRWSNQITLSYTLFMLHTVISALEIECHDASYKDRSDYYQTARYYLSEHQALSVPYKDILRQLDEVLLGRPIS